MSFKRGREKRQPKREKLPDTGLGARSTTSPTASVCSCGCSLKRIGEDFAEKLDYQ